MWGWNHVLVPYCSQDLHSGQVPSEGGLYPQRSRQRGGFTLKGPVRGGGANPCPPRAERLGAAGPGRACEGRGMGGGSGRAARRGEGEPTRRVCYFQHSWEGRRGGGGGARADAAHAPLGGDNPARLTAQRTRPWEASRGPACARSLGPTQMRWLLDSEEQHAITPHDSEEQHAITPCRCVFQATGLSVWGRPDAHER
jgi:hypothetical protein